jgi:hypothetical protein
MGDRPVTRAEEYLALAYEYAGAAERLASNTAGILRPFDALIAQSLELSFKAVLSRQGTPEELLILIGHGLERCRRHTLEDGFATSSEVAALVDELDGSHGAQSLRYPSYIYQAPELEAHGACTVLVAHLAVVDAYIHGVAL